MTEERPRAAWARLLLPDEVARRRLRRAIMREARPLLAARRDGLLDAISTWAATLSPIAAAITLVFAGLALRQTRPTRMAEDTAPAFEELVEPGRALPSAFEGDSIPDLDAVLTVIYESEDTR